MRIATRREAFGNDIKCQAYLCVAYGADGIAYYPYISSGPAPDAPPESMRQEMFILGSQDKSGLCPEYPDTAVTWDARSFIIADPTGVFHKVNDASTGYKWNAGKQVHGVLNRLADTLNGRTFIAAGPWYNLSSFNTVFTYIGSDKFSHDEAFIQVGEFTGADGVDYHMLINRRTWPDSSTAPNHKSDDQRVYFATKVPIVGDKIAVDIISGDTLLLIDSAGYATGSVYLPAGEAAILKFDTTKTHFWKSAFTGIDHFPEGGTHFLSGDITIDSGSTFTIGQGATLKAIANTDSCASGMNTSKTELIVKGNLQAIGSSGNFIHFNATTTTNAAWYGIRVINNGSADIQYASIENAYIGYQNNSSNATGTDLLQLVNFIKCKPYGAVLNKCNIDVENLYILSDLTTAAGIHLDSLADLEIHECGFDSVKYAIEIDHSTPTINDSWFEYCRYGIWIDKNSNTDTADIKRCWFITSELSSGQSCDIVIGQDNSRCMVDSTYFDLLWNYGVLNIYDNSQCHIRRCRFYPYSFYDPTTVYAVYTHGNNTNMGESYDEDSLNYFHFGVAMGDEYYIYNSDASEYTEAHSCCFLDQAEDPSMFYGPIHLADSAELCNCLISFPTNKGRVVSDTILTTTPLEYSMLQNYPNPFNPVTTIAYNISTACDVKIVVYNLLGQVVATLVDAYKTPGEYAIVWDGTDTDGRPVASGMYFYQMVAGDFVSSKKMVMMK
ncbi:MAG: T9SS type A sorting domain-containing protein [candidate division Zixibacteria bacterium]|nr:T9SS type A sorting domain-containing protein [candidate division Zixibacteria bacterium]